MSGTINLSLSQQFDSEGRPLGGGLLHFFMAGTSTPQSAFIDTALTLPYPNPIVLDASGRVPSFYLADGQIKFRLEDKNGLTIFAADNLLVIGPSGGGGGGGGSVDPRTQFQTGDLKPRYGTGFHDGWVRANGGTIGDSSSSSSELQDAAAEALFKFLWSTALPMLTQAGGAATKTTANGDWLGHNRMTLPDFRGRAIVGLDDMGAAAANRLTAAFWGADAKVLGNAGGAESRALLETHVPPHQHSGTTGDENSPHDHDYGGNTDGQSNQHHHPFTAVLGQTSSFQAGPNPAGAASPTGGNTGDASDDHHHHYAGTTGNPNDPHQHDFTTDNGTGSGTAFAVATPSLVVTVYQKL